MALDTNRGHAGAGTRSMSLKVVRLQAFTGEKEQDTTGDGLTPDHSLVRHVLEEVLRKQYLSCRYSFFGTKCKGITVLAVPTREMS